MKTLITLLLLIGAAILGNTWMNDPASSASKSENIVKNKPLKIVEPAPIIQQKITQKPEFKQLAKMTEMVEIAKKQPEKAIQKMAKKTLKTANTAPTSIFKYRFQPINSQVFVMHGPTQEPNVGNQGFMNNPAIVIGKDSIVLIDPGSSYKIGKAVLAQIKIITNKPIAAVFNTHIHGDHWLGNQAVVEQYPNVKIYAHPMMIVRAKEGEGDRWLRIMKNATKGFTKDTKVVYPTNSTAHLQIIKIGSETFKIHNPTEKAHTNTDIMIEHINSKTLFLGDNDLINRLGRFDETADIHSNIKVLKYAIDLNLEYYVPGHGPSGNANSAVKPFLNYLLILKEVTNNGYDNDLLDYEVKPFADARLKAYKNWGSYDTQLGRHINKLMAEMEASYE